MLKQNAMIAPVSFEYLDGGIGTAGGLRGKVSTRRLFPQVTADLSKHAGAKARRSANRTRGEHRHQQRATFQKRPNSVLDRRAAARKRHLPAVATPRWSSIGR